MKILSLLVLGCVIVSFQQASAVVSSAVTTVDSAVSSAGSEVSSAASSIASSGGYYSETVVAAQQDAKAFPLTGNMTENLKKAMDEVREVVKNGKKKSDAAIIKMIASGKIKADKAKVAAKQAAEKAKAKIAPEAQPEQKTDAPKQGW